MIFYLGGGAVVLEADVALADGVGDAHPALGQHGVVLALRVVASLALPTCSTDILLGHWNFNAKQEPGGARSNSFKQDQSY